MLVPSWPLSDFSTDIFQYGCLYDLKTTLLPTPHTSILKVLEDKSASTTLYPTSSLLLLAHIQFNPNTNHPPSHRRQNSDDLIQDLEFTLGSSTTPYLSARVTYRHSSFPDQSSPGCTLQQQTRLETTCTASIKRRNTRSVWSPSRQRQQQQQPASRKRPLFEIVASHWGAEAAADVTGRILLVPKKKKLPAVSIARTTGGCVPGLPPVVPRRKASLRTRFARVAGGRDEEDENEREHDRAKKIWTEIRRMSSVGSGEESDEERKASVSSRYREDRHGQSEVERRRDVIREKALRNRRSVGADTLRSLVPTETEVNTCGQEGYSGDKETTPKRVTVSNIESLNGRGKGKENMRWSWAGWWQ